ncbi:PLP-dependent aminotransferase family protein [Pedobacter gandavensis]|uniref:aminotransferase-like domain-containing protein n=1 Tax=Pedobacter gandavensis TaxID=2679963 RepID=UPI00292EB162|nr:PLP-dependent aminotransferase family protein [Pedobacter gandavensis]
MEKSTFLYEKIAEDLRSQILNGLLLANEKLPSIRNICSKYKVSMSTALKAYYDLESEGLIHTKPQSGYYVNPIRKLPALPNVSVPSIDMGNEDPSILVSKVYNEVNSNHVMLSLGVPAKDFLPLHKLNKIVCSKVWQLDDHGSGYENLTGSANLRRQIARMSYDWGGQLTEDQILPTSGCTAAMAHCLMALTEKGDTIALESPVYFGVLQLARSLGLNILELPTHPQTGIELEALKKSLLKNKVKLCLLISNFSNPMGGTMPLEHKKEVVRLMEHYHIPLIENDMYGDLYFGNSRPVNCKAFDESGLVLLCSSVSKTLAPGYRVGWLSPGKFADKINRVKFAHAISSTSLTQEAVATFLEKGRYENHLKTLRKTLQHNSLRYMEAIDQYFPDHVKVSRPEGGFMLWIELAKNVNTADLYDKAIKLKVSIAPGRMFTFQNQFNNCMRLSYGLPWNESTHQAIKTIGALL